MPPALGAQSLNHWTAREVQGRVFIEEINFYNVNFPKRNYQGLNIS